MPEEIDPLNIDTERQGRELAARSEPKIKVLIKGGKRGQTVTLPVSKWRKAKKDGYLSYKDTTLTVDGDSLLMSKEAKLSPDGLSGEPIYMEGIEMRKKGHK